MRHLTTKPSTCLERNPLRVNARQTGPSSPATRVRRAVARRRTAVASLVGVTTATTTRARATDLGLIVVAGVILAAAVARPAIHDLVAKPAVANFATVFVAIVLQAVPFLALGVTVSAAIGTFVPPGLLPRLLPKHPAAAVPVGAVAGVALPGCECGSVPIARRLIDRGAPGAAALAFLLAAPAINPVVLVATAVAFPGRPEMVVARFAASLLAAVTVGWIWIRLGRDDLLLARRTAACPRRDEGRRRSCRSPSTTSSTPAAS